MDNRPGPGGMARGRSALAGCHAGQVTTRKRRPARTPAIEHRGWFVAGWVLVLLATLMLGLYLVPSLQAVSPTAMAASFVPHAIVLWALAGLVLFLAGNGWGRAWAAAALVGGLIHAQVLVPYTSRFPLPPGPQVTVATLNLHFGGADLKALAASPAAKASVLVLTETTDRARKALSTGAWATSFPHRAGFPDPFMGGTVILSRSPLSEVKRTEERDTGTNAAYRVDTAVGKLVIIGVHPSNPVQDAGVWLRDSQEVLDLAQSVGSKYPRVLVGDFNATLENATLRKFLGRGFADAAATAGSGWQPTYPANGASPPALTIDHVLTSAQLAAVSTQTFEVPGTDHFGLVAVLQRR